MRLSRDLAGPRLVSSGSVIAIGAFDSLHAGHRALLATVVERAWSLGCTPAVVSFEPLPRAFFSRGPVPRLSTVREKLSDFAAMGLARVLLLRFNAAMATMSAQDFVRQALVQRLATREVWVGNDFRFGYGRIGSVVMLERLGKIFGFNTRIMPPVMSGKRCISASRVRMLLAHGEFGLVANLLSRPFTMGGRIRQGNQLGRTLGFPTANIHLHRRVSPIQGIFAVRAGMDENQCHWPGVASVGWRPTVNTVSDPLLEVHLFDFEGDLYGRRMIVEFVAKLRDEEKFASLDALKTQMNHDACLARKILGMNLMPV